MFSLNSQRRKKEEIKKITDVLSDKRASQILPGRIEPLLGMQLQTTKFLPKQLNFCSALKPIQRQRNLYF